MSNAEPPAVERVGRVERDVADRRVDHMADHLVDEILRPVSVPLLPRLVAHHHMDPEANGLPLPPRVSKGVLGDVGALAALPALPLTRAQAHRGDHRVSLRLQSAQRGMLVELPVEVEAADLNATPTGIGEGPEDRSVTVPSLREEPHGDGEPKVRKEEVEGGVVVGAMGAPRLLRLNELRMSRVDRFAVVRNVVEIDGHIDRVPRDMGSGELPERPGERPLGAAEIEEGQKTTGVAVRGPSTAAGTSVGDGGALGGGAEHEIDEVSPSSCREGMGEGRGDQWDQPEVHQQADLSRGEGPQTGVWVGR